MTPEELNGWEIGALAQRAADVLNEEEKECDRYWSPVRHVNHPVMRTTMKLIAKHEQPPVDPLEAEADEVCAKYYEKEGRLSDAADFRAGRCRNWHSYHTALAALRRGIEIERARQGSAGK